MLGLFCKGFVRTCRVIFFAVDLKVGSDGLVVSYWIYATMGSSVKKAAALSHCFGTVAPNKMVPSRLEWVTVGQVFLNACPILSKSCPPNITSEVICKIFTLRQDRHDLF